MITSIIMWIVFGAVIGIVAKLIMPGNQNMGWLLTIALGIVGAFVGGFIASLFGSKGASDGNLFNLWSIVFSLIGALVVLWIYGKAIKR